MIHDSLIFSTEVFIFLPAFPSGACPLSEGTNNCTVQKHAHVQAFPRSLSSRVLIIFLSEKVALGSRLESNCQAVGGYGRERPTPQSRVSVGSSSPLLMDTQGLDSDTKSLSSHEISFDAPSYIPLVTSLITPTRCSLETILFCFTFKMKVSISSLDLE